ncbi:MAG TPA: vWA domain-containing protein [Steroidobacteraceae bacterium]|nr:vWA domain-containing protein [Steroidobacteraceae bacterium]
MSGTYDFAHPWLLLLLPLAVLPLLRNRSDSLGFSYVEWLPRDPIGRLAGWLWRALACLAIASAVIALAGPGRSQMQVTRTGHGAEILVLMDRSRSMDEKMMPSDWRSIDPLSRLAHLSRGRQKSEVARELLDKFVVQRPDDRFSLMFFSTRPMNVVPFTQHDEVVRAGIAAGAAGRGLSNTDAGRALLAAIAEFDHREYSGSRIILLVSDGGTFLTDPIRKLIRSGLQRNRVSLYWIHLKSYNSPGLDSQGPRADAAPEVALHRFFLTLPTPYQVYEAEDPEGLAKAVADVGRQQNFPLDYVEQFPRADYSRTLVMVAALACALLIAGRVVLLREWT